MSLGLVGHELKTVLVDGIQLLLQTCSAGPTSWPVVPVCHKGTLRPEAQRFFGLRSSPESQKILETEGLVHAQ